MLFRSHEIGHICLHDYLSRPFQRMQQAQPEADGQAPIFSPHRLRKDKTVRRLEFQADAFAAALLMPAGMLTKHWNAEHGGPKKLSAILTDINEYEMWDGMRMGASIPEYVASPFALLFHTSRPAMSIRLQRLGLLVDDLESSIDSSFTR